MISGATGRFRFDVETESCQIQYVDEGVERAHRISLVNIVVDTCWQQRRLVSIQAFDEPRHRSPLSQQGDHTMLRQPIRVFTQALCNATTFATCHRSQRQGRLRNDLTISMTAPANVQVSCCGKCWGERFRMGIKFRNINRLIGLGGGGGGIRTHGGLSPTPVFKTGALNHSATPPCLRNQGVSRYCSVREPVNWDRIRTERLKCSSRLAPNERADKALRLIRCVLLHVR